MTSHNILHKKSHTKNVKKGNTKIRTRKIRKHGGIGISNEYNVEQAFNHFYTNSTIELLTDDSGYGIIYVLHLKEDEHIKSPYFSIRSNSINEPIKKLILKMVVMKTNSNSNDEWEYEIKSKNTSQTITGKQKFSNTDTIIIKKLTSNEPDFISELENQIYIFEGSKQFFEPICPSIVYAKNIKNIENNYLKKEMLKYFYSHIEKNITKTKMSLINIYNNCVSNKNNSNFDLGIIAMEMVENSQTVYSYITDPNTSPKDIKKCLKLCVYEHYRLFQLGLLHGDFHLGNALYIPDYEYMDGYNGRVMLIDFGATFDYKKDGINERYKKEYENMNYVEITNIENKKKIIKLWYENIIDEHKKNGHIIKEKTKLKEKCVTTHEKINKLIKDNKNGLSNISINDFIDVMLNICSPSWSNPYDCYFNKNWNSYSWIKGLKKLNPNTTFEKMNNLRQFVIDNFEQWLYNTFNNFDIKNINTYIPIMKGGRKPVDKPNNPFEKINKNITDKNKDLIKQILISELENENKIHTQIKENIQKNISIIHNETEQIETLQKINSTIKEDDDLSHILSSLVK